MKKNIFFIILILISTFLYSQKYDWLNCGTDSVYLKRIQENPNILIEQKQLKDFVKDYIKHAEKNDDTYIIPMVFHVLHYYGEENISYEQILGAVDFLNKDFNHLRDDTTSIINEFKSLAADCNIEFRLAKKDPNGNCTNGVTRTFSYYTFMGGEEAKEVAGIWPPDKYLNVWVVKQIEIGAAGYSYYPGTAPEGGDGVILLYNYVGYNGASSFQKGSALSHEVGHYLSLPHPWGSTNQPEDPDNCYTDDEIEDTPNTIGHKSCDLYAETCGSLDNVQNFMEYSYCTRMFTIGQSEQMRAVLNSSVAGRSNLHSSQNLLQTGTNDDYVEEPCIPEPDFYQSTKIGCAGTTISYYDLTYGTDQITSRNWTFEGGTPSVSDEENPQIAYLENGIFDVNLTSTNISGSNTKNRNNYIRIYNKAHGYELPYTESFETADFPLITGNDNNDFYIEARGAVTWEQTYFGQSGKGLRIKNQNNPLHIKNRVYLPNLKINDDTESILVTFKTAYGKQEGTAGDKLKLYTSTSCGDTLRIVFIASGPTLLSTLTNESTYIPDEEDWKTHSFLIDPIALNGENLRLMVEVEAGSGNTLYIDEFSFSYSNKVENNFDTNLISVFPNPSNGEVYIENQINKGNYQIQIFDNLGRLIYSNIAYTSIYNISEAFEGKEAGLYLIKVTTTNGKVKNLRLNLTQSLD